MVSVLRVAHAARHQPPLAGRLRRSGSCQETWTRSPERIAAGDVHLLPLAGARDGPSNGYEGTNHGSQQGEERCRPLTARTPSPSRSSEVSREPSGELADAELHLGRDSPLAGLKLIGFSIWERRGANGRNVTFPARQYAVNGERRSFALLWPTVDTTAQNAVRDRILEAYAAYEEAAVATV